MYDNFIIIFFKSKYIDLPLYQVQDFFLNNCLIVMNYLYEEWL